MKLIKRGHRLPKKWSGYCRQCGSEYEDTDANVRSGKVESCMREHYDFAHRDCPECGAKAGNAVILYPLYPDHTVDANDMIAAVKGGSDA